MDQTATLPAPEGVVAAETILQIRNLSFFYSAFRAVKDVTVSFAPQRITGLIGPSGCGKSTLLRTMNRMNDLIAGTRVDGEILYHGQDL